MKKFEVVLKNGPINFTIPKLQDKLGQVELAMRFVIASIAPIIALSACFYQLSFFMEGVRIKPIYKNEVISVEKRSEIYPIEGKTIQPVMYTIPVRVIKEEPKELIEDIAEEITYEYTQDEVKILGDTMYAEFGEVLSRLEESEAEHWLKLTGSVPIHRRNASWGGSTIHEIIFSGAYSENTRNAIGKDWLKTPDIVYEWAEELLKYGPIGPKNLIYQSQAEQGIPYDDLFGEYFGLEPSIK